MVNTRILILGGGAAGLSTAWSLARRGITDVVLLEREGELGLHSSGRNAQILRSVGGEATGSVLTLRSAAFLREPPAGFAREPLLDERGLILVSARDADALERDIAAAGSTALALSAAELRAHFPPYHGGHGGHGMGSAFLFPREGRIRTEALLAGFARGARQAGIALRTGTRAAGLLLEAGRVAGARLSDGEELRAGTTVLAAGGWAGGLGATAGSRVRLQPTRRHLMVSAPAPGVDPSWPVLWDLDAGFYCRPEAGGLVCCICDQTDVDPERCEAEPGFAERILERASELLSLDLVAARTWAGVRTLTGDGRFAIGPDPDVESLFWVAGLGGGGLGAAPEVGRLAAAGLACECPDPLAERLDPARLTGAMR